MPKITPKDLIEKVINFHEGKFHDNLLKIIDKPNELKDYHLVYLELFLEKNGEISKEEFEEEYHKIRNKSLEEIKKLTQEGTKDLIKKTKSEKLSKELQDLKKITNRKLVLRLIQQNIDECDIDECNDQIIPDYQLDYLYLWMKYNKGLNSDLQGEYIYIKDLDQTEVEEISTALSEELEIRENSETNIKKLLKKAVAAGTNLKREDHHIEYLSSLSNEDLEANEDNRAEKEQIEFLRVAHFTKEELEKFKEKRYSPKKDLEKNEQPAGHPKSIIKKAKNEEKVARRISFGKANDVKIFS